MEFIIIFILGLVCGFLGGTVGGGGMISLPTLMFLGFPPQSAVAINKVGDVGAFLPAVRNYWGSKKIHWNMATVLIIIDIIASFIGAKLMLSMNTDILKKFIGIIILVSLPFLFFSKDIGVKKKKKSKLVMGIGFVLFAILAIVGAMVGAGGASVALFIMMFFFGYKIVEGYATNTPAEFVLAFIPVIIYAFYGFVQLIPAISIFIGMFIGGYVGSKTAIKKGDKWIKVLFMIVVVALVLKVLFFN